MGKRKQFIIDGIKVNEAVKCALRLLEDNYSMAESVYVASRNFRIDIHEIYNGLRRIEKSLSRD